VKTCVQYPCLLKVQQRDRLFHNYLPYSDEHKV
jgi:hypothetical protein